VSRVDARPLAVTRVLVATAGLVMAVESWTVLRALTTPGVVRVPWGPLPVVPLTNAVVDGWLVVTLVALVMLALGLFCRTAAAASAMGLGISLASDQQLFSNHLALATSLTVLLALGRPGGAWSLDSRRLGGDRTTPLAVNLLLMSQVSTVYLFAGLSKVNEQYLGGSALDRWLAAWTSVPSGALAPLAVMSVVTEVALAVLLWLPRARVVGAVVGVGLHLSIAIALDSPIVLTAFGLLAVSTYPLFLTRPSLLRPADRLSPASP